MAEQARRFGPLRYDEVVDLALYHPELGFYSTSAGPGRGGDFVTSPELGPLFGAVVARVLDEWWLELRRPDPFFVVESGAGTGTLAAAVLAASPECASALRYVLVERSHVQREHQQQRLRLEPAHQVLGPVLATDPDEAPTAAPGTGPLLTSLAELPAEPLVGVILANELLDNLPFRLVERQPHGSGHAEGGYSPLRRAQNVAGGWAEVRVDAQLDEVLVSASAQVAAEAERLAPSAREGARIPLQHQAARWLRSALGAVRRGRVVVIDYVDSTPSLARRPATEWIRTYRGQGPGGPPLAHLGRQDVTCEVAVDQLASVRPPASDTSQAEFLRAHGLDDLLAAARRGWEERAAVGDLEALRARSRLTEGLALADPGGLGGFRVLEWEVE